VLADSLGRAAGSPMVASRWWRNCSSGPVECGPGKTRVAIRYRTSGVVARHGLDCGQVPASASAAVDLVVQDLPAGRTVLGAGNEVVDRALRDLHTLNVSTVGDIGYMFYSLRR